MASPWLRHRKLGSIVVRATLRAQTLTPPLLRTRILVQQLRKSSSAAAGPTAASSARASNQEKPLATKHRQSKSPGPSRSLGARDVRVIESEHPDNAANPAGNATAPAAAPPALRPLPGKIAGLLDLVDKKRRPLISYLPDENLFVRPLEKAKGECFEYRKTVNPHPNQKYKIKLFHQLRASLVRELSVYQKRFRGHLQSGQHRMFGLYETIKELHGALGLARDWALDDWRVVRNVEKDQPFERDNTDASLELLDDGRAGLLWVSIIPQRHSGREQTTASASSHFRWASDPNNLPWNTLKNVLEMAPNGTLKIPALSPSEGAAYQVWTEKAPGLPSSVEVANQVILMHIMPLFKKTYGLGGCKAQRLWGEHDATTTSPSSLPGRTTIGYAQVGCEAKELCPFAS
ncbi:hypothetical protein PG988_010916 [Apiospora saccharicola]